jgi:biofilm PGA synthesis N-glycosyltransferase PgaC
MLILGTPEVVSLFLLSIIFDVPRYAISMLVLYLFEPRRTFGPPIRISAVVACHNEENGLRACIESLHVDEVIVIDDGSTDGTWKVIMDMVSEGLVHKTKRLNQRSSKPAAVNIGLRYATHEAVLILDSDTVLLDSQAARIAARYLSADPHCGGVSLNLEVRNMWASLITRFQAIEYLISITFGKRFADVAGIMSNVSGAAGVFRRSALIEVGGLDIEVAEDAALTGKLRTAGWKIRFAPEAIALTLVPEGIIGLLMQRLRWDSAAAAIWLRKFVHHLNPFARDLSFRLLLTSLDVVLFSIVLPILFPIYAVWLWYHVGIEATLALLFLVMACLAVMETLIILWTTPPLGLLPYVPFYLVVQLFIMRPARIVFMVSELVAHVTHGDNYIPSHQRGELA